MHTVVHFIKLPTCIYELSIIYQEPCSIIAAQLYQNNAKCQIEYSMCHSINFTCICKNLTKLTTKNNLIQVIIVCTCN
jgi:hypothetical protein